MLVAGPLTSGAADAGGESWFGYYGYIDWSTMFDWHRGSGILL